MIKEKLKRIIVDQIDNDLLYLEKHNSINVSYNYSKRLERLFTSLDYNIILDHIIDQMNLTNNNISDLNLNLLRKLYLDYESKFLL